jgi:predicted O-methyltransferase YrrM
MDDVEVTVVGDVSSWFNLEKHGDSLHVCPVNPLPCRVTMKVAGMFRHEDGFFDINTVMGRLVFARGATEGQVYRPFTLDQGRRLHTLFLPAETAPHDDWHVSVSRWENCREMARALLAQAGIPWKGLQANEIDDLVKFVLWPEPLEGCLLHALAQWTHDRGQCIVEIGSFRGRSLAMFALALAAIGNDMPVISIDPHAGQPCNRDHVRLMLDQLGQGRRLVQVVQESDRTCRLLRQDSASLIFIDGNHEYDQVLADFHNYKDILAPGGCMIFHDYGYEPHNGVPEADPGVRQAVDRHVRGQDGFSPLLLAHTQFAFLKH